MPSPSIVKYSLRVTDVIAQPEQGPTPEQPFVVPNNSAFHLMLRNKGPAAVTVHQDAAFITPLPKDMTLLRTFRTPGRLSVLTANGATVEVTVLGIELT